ncbi:MAG TPA: DUF4349 domain-containing protein [Candidatus Sulfotelmatobacter sp.]|jgi:hypothetical protein|nr:DUF4349 domain-containing protein [Candidatus Sulfotelmatobacter sp.]
MRTKLASLLSWFRNLPASRRTILILAALCVGGLALSWVALPTIRIGHRGSPETSPFAPIPPGSQPDAELKAQWERLKQLNKIAGSAPMAIGGMAGPAIDESGYATPMIAHAAELAVATKEFAHSRSAMEEILERHHGYAAKLRMVGQPASSMLTATLRVPASEFTAAVNDLKTLGSVEREEQTADEITQQRADIEARLVNAQNTLERLQGILAKGGKIHNLLEVQRQLASVSAEIARLEAQRSSTEHQVIFAQVLLSLREEVTPPVESVAAEFRNAAMAGLADALSSLAAIALFVISRGPVTMLWVVLVFFPGRWMWRKWHPGAESPSSIPQGVSVG